MVAKRQNWPERLWLVRHGQSQGNVARDAADEAGAHEIGIDMRDVDVPLSSLGASRPSGRTLVRCAAERRAARDILSSPYVRAKQTAEIICQRRRACDGPSTRSSTNGCASASSASSTG